jgi:tripartite-type tricarboxylate transporter receptor subunit TctC
VRILVAAVTLLAAAAAAAQDFPSRPLRVIVLTTPGGPNDFLARLIAERLTRTLGQPVVVENRPGSSGIAGTEFVARQPGDGYTLLNIAAAHVLNPSLVAKLPYDPIRDFEPVTQLVSTTFSLTVGPSLAATSVAEFIAMAKARPGKISYASAGVGSAHHLSGELFKSMTGIDMTHVPYRGSAPALTDMISGTAHVMFDNMPSSLPHIQGGKLRALGVTTAKRSDALPNVPTVAETVAGYEASAWFGMGVPKNTPPEIIEKLNKEINVALADPKMQARLAELGGNLIPGSPADFGKVIADETDKWAKVIKSASVPLMD